MPAHAMSGHSATLIHSRTHCERLSPLVKIQRARLVQFQCANNQSDHMQIRNFSFGATAAIVTSIGLIIGLDAATATKATILSGLLIVAIADNLTDSLSVH